MEGKKVSYQIFLETRKLLKLNTDEIKPKYPVKLRVTYNRKRKYYTLIHSETKSTIYMSEEEFLRPSDPPKTRSAAHKQRYDDLIMLHNELDLHRNMVKLVLKEMSHFDFKQFEDRFFEKSYPQDIFGSYERRIDELKRNEQIGTASSYLCSLNSLKEYAGTVLGETSLTIESITVKFLYGYQKWMLGKGNSKATIGIYLRPLRAIINSQSDNWAEYYNYPFGSKRKEKFEIPKGRKGKIALDFDEITRIKDYKAANQYELLAKSMFMFSYLGSGMNLKDIALLRYRNLDAEGNITFIRAKTANTKSEEDMEISFPIHDEQLKIIELIGNKKVNDRTFIFPFLEDGLSAEDLKLRVSILNSTINKNLKRICKKLEITKNVTFIIARHSFSIMMAQHTPIIYIQSQLGHSNLQTTEHYLKSFNLNDHKDYRNKLL